VVERLAVAEHAIDGVAHRAAFSAGRT
jgi:hypothetical protein